jgi:glycerol-3-phosphate dehydrogenase
VELFERRVAAELASQVTESDDEADGFLRRVPEVREFLVDAAFDPAAAEPVVSHPAHRGDRGAGSDPVESLP